jgi:hypothetical protein
MEASVISQQKKPKDVSQITPFSEKDIHNTSATITDLNEISDLNDATGLARLSAESGDPDVIVFPKAVV